MFNPVIKDLGNVWNRLFDHRPFLNGEIKYFVREFEEKNNNKEVEKLNEVLENITDLKDIKIPRIAASESQLEKLGALLDIALQNCNTTVENEQNFDVDSALAESRARRREEWKLFKEEMKDKYLNALLDATQPDWNL